MRATVGGLGVLLLVLPGCSDSHGDGDATVDAPRAPCDSDRDCSAAGLVCDRATGLCGDCSTDAECTDGTVCLLGSCVAPLPCATSRECPGLVCDAARGRCVECTVPADCDAPLTCRSDGRCAGSVACTTDGECPGGRCDTTASRCVECLTSTDCRPGERCGPSQTCEPTTCGCTTDADCDDGVFCNGSETCASDCAETCTPGTPIVCGVGERCDESSDACVRDACELPQVWYHDADDDGYGDANDAVRGCTEPAGYVARYGDCDDLDVLQSPGAGEACDGTVDENCNGAVDEGCSCTFGTRPCGRLPGCSGMQRCDSGRWGECSVLPPSPELCGGGDEDCDGVTDETSASFYCGAGATCAAGACDPVRIRRIAAGGDAGFALLDDGRVLTWGAAGATPVPLMRAVPARDVSAGVVIDPSYPVTCALLEGARLACGNATGVGVRSDVPEPIAVRAGLGAACGVDGSGGVRCWGLYVNGILGPGVTSNQSTAVIIPGIDLAVDVVVGSAAACALRRDGDLRCWGIDGQGMLGNGTTGPSLTPVAVTAVDDASSLVGGLSHVCVERPSGIWCWGRNDWGQLGDGTTAMVRSSPIPATVWPSGARLPRSLAAASTCVRTVEGTVLCVGEGSIGQLGHGRMESSSTPVEVTGLTGVVDLAGNSSHWCALTGSGEVSCWGQISSGSLGDGTTLMSATPVRVTMLP